MSFEKGKSRFLDVSPEVRNIPHLFHAASSVFGVHGKNPQTMDVGDHGIAETTASTAMDKSPLVKITASTGFNSRNHGQVHGKS